MSQRRKPTDVGTNRTGAAIAPLLTRQMLEGQKLFTPSADGDVLLNERIALSKQAPPVGSMPLPPSLKGALKSVAQRVKGAHPMVFLDKLGERLAFERGGVRLYQALLVKHAAASVHEGGPTREELERFCDEELDHFRLLREAIETLGADPTAVTPCADVGTTATTGIVQVLTDPRVTLTQALDAILVAELADNDGWRTLIVLAEGFGEDALAERFRRALAEEDDHLAHVRRWLATALAGQAGVAETRPQTTF